MGMFIVQAITAILLAMSVYVALNLKDGLDELDRIVTSEEPLEVAIKSLSKKTSRVCTVMGVLAFLAYPYLALGIAVGLNIMFAISILLIVGADLLFEKVMKVPITEQYKTAKTRIVDIMFVAYLALNFIVLSLK